MAFTPGSTGSVASFVAITSVVIIAFLSGVWFAHRGNPVRARQITFVAASVLAIWIGLLGAITTQGQMTRLPFSGLPIFFGSVFIVAAVAGLSSFGRQLAVQLPLAALVGFQAFRLPLELVLHEWAATGTVPATMTWTGQNWDVISGLTALLMTPLANRWAVAAWVANITGIVLLLNVIRVAILSSPFPFAWGVEPPLVLALHLPYMLIGPICVGGAFAGHIVLTRALLAKSA